MFEAIIDTIEDQIMYLSWHSLLGLSVACTPAGLIIWLYGLGMARVAAATIGGFTGFFTAYILLDPSTLILAIWAAAGIAMGLVLESALIALIGYATLAYSLIVSVVSAAGGTALVFVGTISLIRLEGYTATKHISSHQIFYLVAMSAMITFGTIKQLVFRRRKAKALSKSKAALPQVDIEPTQRTLWRTR